MGNQHIEIIKVFSSENIYSLFTLIKQYVMSKE